jgi:putative ABC transport system permease protein
VGALRRFFVRLVNAVRPGRAEPDLAREVSSHLTLLEDEFRRRGMSEEGAKLAARGAFGGVEQTKELHRDARSFVWLDDARRDLRYALRILRRSPGFSAVAIVTLALGIGSTATIFSFVNAVLLNPLAYPASDRLVVLATTMNGTPVSVTPGDFLEWQAQNHSFEAMAAGTVTPFNLTGRGEPVGVLAGLVSDRFTETLHVAPQLGHTFAVENRADGSQSVVISDHLWRRRFNADPAIIGNSVRLEGAPYTVVGVMQPGVSFPRELMSSTGARTLPDVDLWVPLTLRPNDRTNGFLKVVARLRSDVTVAQAQAEMATIQSALAGRFMPRERNIGMRVVQLQEQIVRAVRPLLLTLFSAVILLLVVACANVANLLLGRAAARDREVAIRSALGSGTRRLIQQYLIESVLLAAIGGALGLLLTNIGVHLMAALIPPGTLPRVKEVRIDSHVLIFSMAVSVITGLTFGLVPAMQAGHTDVTTTFRGTGAMHTTRSRYFRFLIAAEVALAFVLLVGAGLLFKSLARLTSVNPGFRPESILTLDVTLPEGGYPTLAEMRAFSSAVLEGIRHTPAVMESGAVNLLPIGGPLLSGGFILEGVPRPRGFTAVKPAVSPGYFSAMGIAMLRGRDFNEQDTDQAPGVAVVTEQFARRAWPGQDAIGKRLKLGFGRPEEQPWLTLVGVVGDVKQSALADETRPAIYVPLTQAPRPFLLRNLSFVARTTVDPRSVASVLREQIHRVDPLLPVGRVATMTQLMSDSVAEPRFRAILLGAFGGSAVVLIGVGMLGVLGFFVARRRQEIGLRMAVGAQRADIATLVVKQALAMTGIGIACGATLAFAVTRLLERFLFEISPHDPAIFVLMAAVLCVMSLVASYVPVQRATKIDPFVALRCE